LLLATRLARLAYSQKPADVTGFHSTNRFNHEHNCLLLDVVVVVVVAVVVRGGGEAADVVTTSYNYKKKNGTQNLGSND
jgi:hypothetical protein